MKHQKLDTTDAISKRMSKVKQKRVKQKRCSQKLYGARAIGIG
jgi:hypothetical protein